MQHYVNLILRFVTSKAIILNPNNMIKANNTDYSHRARNFPSSLATQCMRLCLMATIAFMPLTTQAQYNFGGGGGTKNNPYRIKTRAQLDSIRSYLDNHFVLKNDLDFDGYSYADGSEGWNPINDFTGTFHGKGFVISNLSINRPEQGSVGLFGSLGSSAKIDSLGLENINIIGGAFGTGGMVGLNEGTITHSYAQGQVQGGGGVGGLVGQNFGAITLSYASGEVKGDLQIGGLVGRNDNSSGDSIANCYAYSLVTASSGEGGGLVGNNADTIEYCYAAGFVVETGAAKLRGLVGLIDDVKSSITESYWNVSFSGITVGHGTGLSTAQMFEASHFEGWDFYDATDNPDGVWLPPVEVEHFPLLRGVRRNAQAGVFPPPALPLKKETTVALEPYYTLLPPTLPGITLEATNVNPNVLTINSEGQITPKNEGADTITITREGNDDYTALRLPQKFTVVDPTQPGTLVNPYKIYRTQQLDSIRDYTSSGGENYLDDHYVLMDDLDFTGYNYADGTQADGGKGWKPIANFAGSLNGKGHVIRHLFIHREDENNIGLFGNTEPESSIDSLGVEEVEISGEDHTGGLAGQNRGTISNCHVTGRIKGDDLVGGLVGRNLNAIDQCYTSVHITGDNEVGGLVGRNIYDWRLTTYIRGSITSSYSASWVEGETQVGGLLGAAISGSGSALLFYSYQDPDIAVGNCYAVGRVDSVDGSTRNFGGLVGGLYGGLVRNSYAAIPVEGTSGVGALVGHLAHVGYLLSNHWNTDLQGPFIDYEITKAALGTGLSTVEMFDPSHYFSDWDFYDEATNPDGAWLPPVDGQHFPLLRGVSKNAQVLDFPPIDTVGVLNTFPLDYLLLPPSIADADVVIENSNEEVASINDDNQVVALEAGTTTITVSRAGNAKYIPAASLFQELVVFEHPFAGGSGTEKDPFHIATPAQLDSIRDHSPGRENYLDDHFILIADLDFSDYAYADGDEGWQPIGHDTDNATSDYQGTPFTGSFDGRGHVIYELSIQREEEDFIGLFGALSASSRIDSLGLSSLAIQGRHQVGGLAGSNEGRIAHSYALGEVEGVNTVGGLAGIIPANGIVVHSYAGVETSGSDEVGGLTGKNEGAIDTCYATGAVVGTTNVGGLSGAGSGSVTDSYWNSDTSGQTAPTGGGTSLTTTQMYDTDATDGLDYSHHFSGFDFTDTWLPPTNEVHFPLLRELNGQQYVTLSATNASITEDQDAVFTLTRAGVIKGTLEANVKVSQEGLFTSNVGDDQLITFAEDALTATLTVDIDDDDLDEEDGSITASIKEGQGYELGLSNVSATVAVEDDDLPAITIVAQVTVITEGEDAVFTLTRIGLTLTALTVDITVLLEGGEFLEGAAPTTVTFEATEATTTLQMTTLDDSEDEPSGLLTVSIIDRADYVARDGGIAVLQVKDNDGEPDPEVSIVAIETLIEEGEDAVFMLTRVHPETDAPMTGEALPVNIEVSQEGAFVSTGIGSRIVTFEDGASTATFMVETEDDLEHTEDGTITATIELGAAYLQGENISTSVAVEDNDLPTVAIVADAPTITEGISAMFTLSRTGTTTEELSVEVNVSQTGMFTIETGKHTVTFSVGSDEVPFSVRTLNDDKVEEDGSLTVAIEATNANYEVDVSASEATVIAIDDDLPEVSITPVSTSATEGEDAVFMLTRTSALEALQANVEVTQIGDYVSVTASPFTVDFEDGEATAMLTVATVDDDTDESNGVVTATLKEGTGYLVGTPSSANMGISDNDGKPDPEVHISVTATTVTEGTSAVFTLMRSGETSGVLSVNVEVTEGGGYVVNASDIGLQTIDFSDGEATVMLTVETVDNDLDEPSGVIRVVLKPGVGYSVSTPSLAEVSILDDEGTPDPEVRITANVATVIEGENAAFTLTRSSTSGALSVDVEVRQSGDYVADASVVGSQAIEFAEGEETAMLTVATMDDDIDEPSGLVMATLRRGVGYLPVVPLAVEVGIKDNDGTPDPEVAITASAASIVEGEDVMFTLTRTSMSGVLSVNVEVTQTGDYVNIIGIYIVDFTDGEATASLTVATVDDDTDESNGVVMATLVQGVGYSVGTPPSAEVGVIDNDGMPDPEVSISTTATTVAEGTSAEFTLMRASAWGMLSVDVEVSQEGDYVADASAIGSRTIEFADGEATATLTVETIDDDTDESNGSITATLKQGAGYSVGTSASAVVEVTDNDEEMPPVGLKDKEDMALFPNPVGRKLSVRLPEARRYQLTIYTLSGRRERTYHVEPRQETVWIDVSDLLSGIYVVTLTDDNGQSVHYRMVKE